jgi:hypothetical protein
MTKRVAVVQDGFIVNVVIYDSDRELVDGEMLEEDAISQGLTWKPEDVPEPEPDFRAMAEALRKENGFKDAFLEAQPLEPMAVGSLTSRFDDFRKDGDFVPFLQSMLLVLDALPPQKAAHIGMEFLAVAHRCHMPPAFLQALQDAFDAE